MIVIISVVKIQTKVYIIILKDYLRSNLAQSQFFDSDKIPFFEYLSFFISKIIFLKMIFFEKSKEEMLN